MILKAFGNTQPPSDPFSYVWFNYIDPVPKPTWSTLYLPYCHQEDKMPTKEVICGFRREAYRHTTDIVWTTNLFFLRLCHISRQKIAYRTRRLRHDSYKLRRQCCQYGNSIVSIALYKPAKSSTEEYLWTISSPLEKQNITSQKSPIEEYLWATNSPLKHQTLTVKIFIQSICENDSFFVPYSFEQRGDGSELRLELPELPCSMQ